MVRTQIQLTEKQSRILKAMSLERGLSMAELIRQSVELFVRSYDEPTLEEKYEQVLSLAGKYESDVNDLSTNHDKYLTEVYGVVGE